MSKYETGERRLDVVEFLDVAGVLGMDIAGQTAKPYFSQLIFTADRSSRTGEVPRALAIRRRNPQIP